MRKVSPKNRTRPRKLGRPAQVKAAYLEGGKEAARVKGKELRVRKGRVEKWLRKWERDSPSTPTPASRPRIRPKNRDPVEIKVGAWYCLNYNEEAIGRCVGAGPEQSDIKWKSNGMTWCVPNNFLEEIEPPN